MSEKRKKYERYPIEVRLKAVKLYKSRLTYRQVAKELNIRTKSQIMLWMKKDREGVGLQDSTTYKVKPRSKTQFKNIEEELAYVKVENEYLKKLYQKLKED